MVTHEKYYCIFFKAAFLKCSENGANILVSTVNITIILGNLLADLLYGLVDPRIRDGDRRG